MRGVLVVQNRAQRQYSDEEVETLEVIGVVIAELIASGGLVSPVETAPAQGNAVLAIRLEGVRINGGLAMGEAVHHTPRVSIPQLVADDPAAEHRRLAEALSSMHSELDDMLALDALGRPGEHLDVLHAYRKFAEDRGWLRRIGEAIDGGLTAEAAVQKVLDDTRARMRQITDPYLSERMADLEDLAYRMLHHLTGDVRTAHLAEQPEALVLVAHSIGPAELLDYAPRRLKALILEEGSANSHVAIVARALDIPVVGRVKGALSQVDPMDPVIVDGDHSQVYVRPAEDIQQTVAEHFSVRQRRLAAYSAKRDEPAVTKDGVYISLNVNAGLLMDLQSLEASGADGVGLYRTEIPFMLHSELPGVEAQIDLYRRVLEGAAGRPVRFRTLDIGGDKQLPYFRDSADQNPAMGWRSIRVALDRPSMLRQQLRALIVACDGGPLSVMFPMIAEVAEFEAARAILDLEVERAKEPRPAHPRTARGRRDAGSAEPDVAARLAPAAGRLPVGRQQRPVPVSLCRRPRQSPGGGPLRRAFPGPALGAGEPGTPMRRERSVAVSLCGEMAGRPIEAMALIGVGLPQPVRAGGHARERSRRWSTASTRARLPGSSRRCSSLPDHSIRERLRDYAIDHGIELAEL